MLLAYIDEIGETGAFVSRDHARYNTSPAFGYAGFIIPEDKARYFGSLVQKDKASLFKREIAQAEHPGRWEKKVRTCSALIPARRFLRSSESSTRSCVRSRIMAVGHFTTLTKSPLAHQSR